MTIRKFDRRRLVDGLLLTALALVTHACRSNSPSGVGGMAGEDTANAMSGGTAGTLGLGGNAVGGGAAGNGGGLGGTGAAAGGNGGLAAGGNGGLASLPTAKFECETAKMSSTSPAVGDAAIEADVTGGDGSRIFQNGVAVIIAFATRTTAVDHVEWSIRDNNQANLAMGGFDVPSGAKVTTVTCTSTIAGYFALSASLRNGAALPQRGSRPAGIATFGVLPDLSGVLKPAVFLHPDDHRFGIQGTTNIRGGNGFTPLYGHLGTTWTNDGRSWEQIEPSGPNGYDESKLESPSVYATAGLVRYITINGIPAWASASGKAGSGESPKSYADYATFLSKVAAQQSLILKKWFPQQTHNYYQVTWEPDPGPGTQWRGSIADFLNLYKTAYQALHGSDPKAVVLGPADYNLGNVVSMKADATSISLNNPALADLPKYLDGLSVHGYYTNGCIPEHPPEATSIFEDMRALRHAMATKLAPHAKLISSEMGINYGAAYSASYPSTDYLFQHGAIIPRAHLILLGEGMDVTYVFYAADFSAESGFGVNFNLVMPSPDFGTNEISPKPAAMLVATMTRMVDGSVTMGRIKGMPVNSYGYAFQRTEGSVVSALWAHAAAYNAKVSYALAVDVAGVNGSVVVVDGMGNPKRMPIVDGKASLMLTEIPQYVISTNADVMKASTLLPEGYDPAP